MNSSNKTNNNLFTKEFTKDPYRTYAELRDTDPICKTLFPDGQYGWMITKYEDAVEVLKDLRFIKDFSKLIGGKMEYDS
ncbi:cytochrome P450, partial [Metabacillus fastidiosus]|nr:cytochrome P450 [Metabacillus fastidiosus]